MRHNSTSESARRQARRAFVRQLQLAYSGELGAAIAYRGHAASVTAVDERHRIAEIRVEELDHRACIGRLLSALHARPDPALELRNRCVGSTIALFCNLGGWFLPMYGAGWIERRNIAECERAARLGAQCGAVAAVAELLDMAEVEWTHERFFRLKAASHWLARVLRVWPAPPPQAEIRRSFRRFLFALPAEEAVRLDRQRVVTGAA